MVALSLMRIPCRQGWLALGLGKPGSSVQALLKAPGVTKAVVRQMGAHKNVIPMQPSKFEWYRFRNDFHFFALLGAVPLGLLTLYVNLFIGNAELADIPEGYEPEDWEYCRSPITQFICRTMYDSMQMNYEKRLHMLHENHQKRLQKMLERKVHDMMAASQDYMGWYYVPVSKSYVDLGKDSTNKVAKDYGHE
ncbi:NADH dehydrogenase [ubiquinone] 1 beta subcomplex subunit 5, mitochondrial-like [Argonauta hians]